ncbi:hypothetical protein K435DRAFT_798008 [Dendrothele bispora CBS 962.96]|uniref:Uncharacterized protein n=1 Tax=Dendrothele bispora (strain CBS 962.96) TaxID=1314807 RepID=A0A4S8M1Y0_DENBC|nr:hypothetical protein K435DRAFT_798008 [Dendrothele bispora CBS 962.96]
MSAPQSDYYSLFIVLNLPLMVINDGPGSFNKLQLLDSSRITVFGLYILANITADIVLVQRCYKIWGAKKKIIVFPVFISVINNAGRIWWIGHQVSKFLPKRKFHLTKHVLAVCLESGIMYPLALIPALAFAFQTFIVQFTPSFESLVAVLIQVVGIAPTFIIDTIHMNEGSGRDNQVISMWEANRNIDECDQIEQSAV